MERPAAGPRQSDHYNDHMTRQVTATEAKSKLLALLHDVEDGQHIEITRHGHLIARIVPARGVHSLRGRFAGVITSSDDEEELFSTGVEWELR
jgi:prevent-host-death family protein